MVLGGREEESMTERRPVATQLDHDPNAVAARVVVLSVSALLFTAFAGWTYRPMFRETDHVHPASTTEDVSDEDHPLG